MHVVRRPATLGPVRTLMAMTLAAPKGPANSSTPNLDSIRSKRTLAGPAPSSCVTRPNTRAPDPEACPPAFRSAGA